MHARLACGLPLACAALARAQEPPPPPATAATELKLPYAFYNELFGAAGAYVYSRDGFPQRGSRLLATAMVGTKGSGMLFLRAKDLAVPGAPRLSVDPIFSVGYFHDNKVFLSGNPRFASERAGANESSSDDYLEGNGWDNYLRVSFRYLLPIGWGRDHVAPAYHLDGGLLTSGATGGGPPSPLASGKTYVGVRPFFRAMNVHTPEGDRKQTTSGLDAELVWDNRDFPANPLVGQSVKLTWSRDFGRLGSTNAWTFVSAEVDHYVSLGASGAFRQRVLALDFWTGTSPSWESRADGTVASRPPTFEGAYLGGLWRMRGYRFARFSDKAAIYYAAEYRMIPRWNPFASWRWMQKKVGVEWIQIVPFAEAGRVAPTWNLATLHSSMKWDAGLGVRAYAKGLLIRVDVAGSREDLRVQMMVDAPFQF